MNTRYFTLIFCLLSLTSLYAMENSKKAKVADSRQAGAQESKSNSNSPTKNPQHLLKYFEPRLPLSHSECTTVDLSTALCLVKSGRKLRVSDLKEICFSSCGLSIAPLGFSQLTNLVKLSLEYNSFSRIPDDVCCHSSLTDLDISHNPLEEFPTLTLPNLRILTAKGANISKFPDTLGCLQSLRVLTLSDNTMTELHPSLFQLTGLEQLDLSNNKLSFIPEDISLLTALQELSANDNTLETLPSSIGALRKLRSLCVDNNQLTSLPESFKHLESLCTFFAKHNKLKEIQAEIGELRALQELHLDHNEAIQALPSSLTTLHMLQTISLTGTRLAELLRIIGRLQKRDTVLITQ